MLVVAKIIRDSERLWSLKPDRTKNEVEKPTLMKNGNITLSLPRYKTRITRPSEQVTSLFSRSQHNMS
jgi:hypothetical protein